MCVYAKCSGVSSFKFSGLRGLQLVFFLSGLSVAIAEDMIVV